MPLIAILTDTPQTGASLETRYGLSDPIRRVALNGSEVFVVAPGTADPRATVRALKDQGVTHLWLCEAAGALSPLLEPGDWLIPDDYIDGTRGQHYTYFDEKVGGFVQQVVPFDPASREALMAGAQALTPRPFRRGIYVCVSQTRLETPAEAMFWTRAGGHVAGRFLSPYLTLARELEMAVAVLVTITRRGGEAGTASPFEAYLPVLAAAVGRLKEI